MSLKQLFEIYDCYETLCIEINDIRDQILEFGVQDEINFHFVQMDEEIVRGFLHRYTVRDKVYGEPKHISDIYIAESLDEDWKRVVAAKELLHILDTEKTSAQSVAAVDALLENLSLPPEVRGDSYSSVNDHVMLISAIAILVPKECRKIIRRLHSDNGLDLNTIAQFANIPHRFTNMLLSENFDATVVSITGMCHDEKENNRS
jgi:hypothetical protein